MRHDDERRRRGSARNAAHRQRCCRFCANRQGDHLHAFDPRRPHGRSRSRGVDRGHLRDARRHHGNRRWSRRWPTGRPAVAGRRDGGHSRRQYHRGRCTGRDCPARREDRRRRRLHGCRAGDPEHARAARPIRHAGYRDGGLERVHAGWHHADAVCRAALADDRLAPVLVRQCGGGEPVCSPARDPCAGDVEGAARADESLSC